ncbi:unnamed protein product [Gordionus sp. m RMFG-2023]
MANLLKGTSGQTLVDRVTAAKHTLSGAGLAKSVCKATTEEIIAPKRKHLEDLVNYTNEPNISIPQMANHLIDRSMSSNWVVVYKSLISVHHLMCYGNERFTQYLATNNCAFQLSNFLDRSTSAGYDMSLFVKKYSNYLNEKAITYRHMGFDFCKIKRGKDGVLRTMNPDKLIKSLPVLQNQLDALLNFNCNPCDINNAIINNCFILLFRDLVRLFACYNDGNMNLLEAYWTMNKKQSKEALEIYKNFLLRMDRVSEFLKSAEAAGIDKSDIPDITKIPTSLLESMEQHLAYLDTSTNSKKDKKLSSSSVATSHDKFSDKTVSNGPPAEIVDAFAALNDNNRTYNDSIARNDKLRASNFDSFERNVFRDYKDFKEDYSDSGINEKDKQEALREEAKRLDKYKQSLQPNASKSQSTTPIHSTYNIKQPQSNNIKPTPAIDIFDSLMAMSPEEKFNKANNFGNFNNLNGNILPPNNNRSQNAFNPKNDLFATDFDAVFDLSPSLPLGNKMTNGFIPNDGSNNLFLKPKNEKPIMKSPSSPINDVVNSNKVIVKGDLESSLANLAASFNIQSHDQALKKTTHQWTNNNTNISSSNAFPLRSSPNTMTSLNWIQNQQQPSTINDNLPSSNWATFQSTSPINAATGVKNPFQQNQAQSSQQPLLTPNLTLLTPMQATSTLIPTTSFISSSSSSVPNKNQNTLNPFISLQSSTINNYNYGIHQQNSLSTSLFNGANSNFNNLSTPKDKETFKSLDNLNVWPTGFTNNSNIATINAKNVDFSEFGNAENNICGLSNAKNCMFASQKNLFSNNASSNQNKTSPVDPFGF